MHSNKNFKILNHFLLAIFFCLTTLSSILTIPATTLSAVSKTVTQISESQAPGQNTTNGGNALRTQNSLKDESNGKIEIKSNQSMIIDVTTDLSPTEFEINNNKINGKSPVVDQLTELSALQMNTPSVETKPENNDISSNLSENTDIPMIMSTDANISNQNSINDSNSHEYIADKHQNTSDTGIPLLIKNQQNMAIQTHNTSETMTTMKTMTINDSHRNKRSFLRNSLHSNLDELLNIKRERRASMRPKRNTNYEDLLASLLAAEVSNNNDNFMSYPDNNDLNALALNYFLKNMNSDESENKYIDLDKLSQYYYENLLPLIDNIDTNSESTTEEDNVSQDLPIMVQPYSQSVIPVIPYSVPNRYQRIRRSYFNRYRNPISLYTGLKRKRGHNRGEWGRIVGANSERSAYDDEAQEANKIYSLATLLATDNTPEENRFRYKRSVKRSVKPVMYMKNM